MLCAFQLKIELEAKRFEKKEEKKYPKTKEPNLLMNTQLNFSKSLDVFISKTTREQIILQASWCYLILNSCTCTYPLHTDRASRFDSNFEMVCLLVEITFNAYNLKHRIIGIFFWTNALITCFTHLFIYKAGRFTH